LIAQLLALFFPPKMPGYIQDWGDRVEYESYEQGRARLAPRYRNGIERHFAEEDEETRRTKTLDNVPVL
jgi:hypothetical protein